MNCRKFAEQICRDGMAYMAPWMLSTPSTFIVTVFTRHSRDCSYKDNPQWKRCKCRKSVYICEGGKRLRMSIRTRSGGQAEKLAPSERDKHESIKIELKRTVDEEARKANEQQAKRRNAAVLPVVASSKAVERRVLRDTTEAAEDDTGPCGKFVPPNRFSGHLSNRLFCECLNAAVFCKSLVAHKER